MRVRHPHPWQLSPREAAEVQRSLAVRVRRSGGVPAPRLIAGVDVSVSRARGMAAGAVVVLDYPGLSLVEGKVVRRGLGFPYVPGLLSFREAPVILEACAALTVTPDLLLVDGQGVAHPRRFGLASHLGVLLGVPTIGCAKSRLWGDHEMPAEEAGASAELTDGDEVIGAVVRTRRATRPVFVSVGHLVGLEAAVRWVLACCRGFRLPEPVRLAHRAAGGTLKV